MKMSLAYVAIDCKLENKCELQNSACGKWEVIFLFKLVKHSNDDDDGEKDNSGLIDACVVLKELVEPWWNTKRIVCSDSYFVSVSTAKELLRFGLRIIGVVKTTTKSFLMWFVESSRLMIKTPKIQFIRVPFRLFPSFREGLLPSILFAIFLILFFFYLFFLV